MPFAEISKNSKEYQGHGWGCSFLKTDEWIHYHNISPIWDDDLTQFGRTSLLLAHARSAFEDRDIRVENNMPFSDGSHIFIFNGELRGVRIKETGRIGAEKIFNFIRRFNKGDMQQALKKAVAIIRKRTDYIKAMNIILADKNRVHVSSLFNDEPDYFTLHQKEHAGGRVICSEPYPGETDWTSIENETIKGF
jgi:glutamine amidotransferase